MQLAKQLAVDEQDKARLVHLSYKERRTVDETQSRDAAHAQTDNAPQLGRLEPISAVASPRAGGTPTKKRMLETPDTHSIGTPREAANLPPRIAESQPFMEKVNGCGDVSVPLEGLHSSIESENEATKEIAVDNSTQEVPSDEAAAKANIGSEEVSDWSTGVVRVLIITRGGVPSCQEATRSARLEQWCQKCNIHDVTFAVLNLDSEIDGEHTEPSVTSARFRAAVREPLLQRTQPGDTWVLLVAGLDLPESSVDTTDVSDASRAIVLVDEFPAHVTIVCLTDSRKCLERLGLQDAALASLGVRMVTMMLLSVGTLGDESEQNQRRDLCTSAMLRAADALSLADGPCSLSCDDFFQELTDQALGLAASSKISPQAVLRTYPQDDDLATIVRWPIAALPRNSVGSKLGDGDSLWTLSPSLREPAPAWRRSEEPPAPVLVDNVCEVPSVATQLPRGKSPASKYEPRSFLPRASWSSVTGKRETSKEPSPPSKTIQQPRPRHEAMHQKDVRHRSNSRGMPTSLGGLSVMLTGGLKEAPLQQQAAKEQRSNVGAQERRCSSTRRRQNPAQYHDNSIE